MTRSRSVRAAGDSSWRTPSPTPDNPLTARVMVNRVWQHLFGEGLVRTPSDFGARGAPPTHPELLDYLTVTFIEDGWSVKKLIRRIVTSSVYRQASDDRPDARAVDPENELLWRMNRRRLDFEALARLAADVAGRLESTLGGPPFALGSDALHAAPDPLRLHFARGARRADAQLRFLEPRGAHGASASGRPFRSKPCF